MFVIVLVIILIFALAVWDYRKSHHQQRSLADKILARFKILLGFYQVSGAIFSTLNKVTWPNQLSGLGNILQILELNVLQLVAKPHCYLPNLKFNAYDEFIISIAFIVFVLMSALVGNYSTLCYLKFIKRMGDTDIYCRMTAFKKKCYMYVILLLFITYPSMCNVILALLPPGCDEFCLDENDEHCVRKLRTDYSIDCDSDIHTFFTYAAYVSFIYVIGFPSLLFMLLYLHSRKADETRFTRQHSNQSSSSVVGMATFDLSLEPVDDEFLNLNPTSRNLVLNDDEDDDDDDDVDDDDPLLDISQRNVDDNKFPLWLRFLCENYRDDFWYWEILELLRKILQTALVVLFGSDDPWYLTVTIAISVMFLTSHAYFKPMNDSFEHRLQMSSLAAIFLNLLVAMALMMPNKDQSSAAQATATTVVLILLNTVVVFVVAGNVLSLVII